MTEKRLFNKAEEARIIALRFACDRSTRFLAQESRADLIDTAKVFELYILGKAIPDELIEEETKLIPKAPSQPTGTGAKP